MSERIEFSPAVKVKIAGRVNFHCSVPRCSNPARGPSTSLPAEVTNMGTVCHIYSAAEKGPRGQGGKDEAWIASAENGLWCCNYHGSLIDKHRGADYPADKLFSWKRLAEARVRKQMDNVPSPQGWVDSIEITKCNIFKVLPLIRLGRWTLIYHKPATGMSLLLEMAAGISSDKYSYRWIDSSSRHETNPLETKALIRYSTVDEYAQEIEISCIDGVLRRSQAGVNLMQKPRTISTVFCSRGGA